MPGLRRGFGRLVIAYLAGVGALGSVLRGWGGGRLCGWRVFDLWLHVIDFTTGQVGDLPHGLLLRNQSQIGLPLFAETLQFVQSAVEAALHAGFLAAEHVQRLGAEVGYESKMASVIQVADFSALDGVFHLEGIEATFDMVEAAEAPGGHRQVDY